MSEMEVLKPRSIGWIRAVADGRIRNGKKPHSFRRRKKSNSVGTK